MQRYTELENLLIPVLDSLQYDLVRLMMRTDGNRKVLQIMIERKDLTPVTVDDCERASKEISAVLDVEDPISDAYDLEVSSCGLDRPLVRLNDFVRFVSYAAKIETETPISGCKHFKGKILGCSETEEIRFAAEGMEQEILIPYSVIKKAKLIITDELIKQVTLGNKGF